MTIPLLPESAPFAPAQRAWLNGFFAGVLSLDAQPALNPPSPAPTISLVEPTAANLVTQPATLIGEEDFPWHDPTLTLEERERLAEGRPPVLRLMAAMAQLDCGTCGYVCQTYAEAISRGDETDLTKCTPGGKETTRALKRIVAEGMTLSTSAQRKGR